MGRREKWRRNNLPNTTTQHITFTVSYHKQTHLKKTTTKGGSIKVHVWILKVDLRLEHQSTPASNVTLDTCTC